MRFSILILLCLGQASTGFYPKLYCHVTQYTTASPEMTFTYSNHYLLSRLFSIVYTTLAYASVQNPWLILSLVSRPWYFLLWPIHSNLVTGLHHNGSVHSSIHRSQRLTSITPTPTAILTQWMSRGSHSSRSLGLVIFNATKPLNSKSSNYAVVRPSRTPSIHSWNTSKI